MSELKNAIRDTKTYIGLPLLHEHWYVAGLSEEFGRELVARTLLEKSIVFYRTEAGELVALQNRCLHRSYPLAESTLSGDNIVCGYHGIEYSPQGEIKNVPCQTQCPKGKLRKYPTKELGPFVFIWMGNPNNANENKLPEIPYLDNPEYMSFYGKKFEVNGNYLMLQDNLNDLSHFLFIHAGTFGAELAGLDESFLENSMEYEERNGVTGCFRLNDDSGHIKQGLIPDQLEAIGDRKIRSRTGGITHSPGVWLGEGNVYVDSPAPGQPECYAMHINHYFTPEKHNSCHYWYSVTADYMPPIPEISEPMHQLFRTAFEEDVVAINHMQKLFNDDSTEYQELNINGDKAGVLMRRKILEWALQEYPELET